ncbi:hypothetical protein CDCA_CDCA04G1201 [Cyanidium caldarium]|uniref:Uncharacterized protein n=1 Tax=Cyanidium caldarium TaxID=2771 RepID=A0AAV9ISM3_CYACA|nr:hypothetical protein CDCA_CDCA04G1201 [Cyanidium caldarium]
MTPSSSGSAVRALIRFGALWERLNQPLRLSGHGLPNYVQGHPRLLQVTQAAAAADRWRRLAQDWRDGRRMPAVPDRRLQITPAVRNEAGWPAVDVRGADDRASAADADDEESEWTVVVHGRDGMRYTLGADTWEWFEEDADEDGGESAREEDERAELMAALQQASETRDARIVAFVCGKLTRIQPSSRSMKKRRGVAGANDPPRRNGER